MELCVIYWAQSYSRDDKPEDEHIDTPNISTTTGWITLKFGEILDETTGDSQTFHLAPLAGQNVFILSYSGKYLNIF